MGSKQRYPAALALFFCASLWAGDLAELRKLQEADRMFDLRRMLEQPGWVESEVSSYRAAVAARFGREIQAIEARHGYLAERTDKSLDRKAHEELASALFRVGRYGEGASAMAEALLLTPANDFDRSENENTRALFETLRDVPPQTVELLKDSATVTAMLNPAGSWNVPVECGGYRGNWLFDTGANLSVLSESEAKRMGLFARDTGAHVGGSTGKKNALRLAIAKDLMLGPARLHNVVFIVLPDEALYIAPLKYAIQGIVGLPVIRALERIELSPKGAVRIGGAEPVGSGEPNVFFDELSLVMEAAHGARRWQLLLDTGSNNSFAYPSLRDALAQEHVALKKKKEVLAGMGGKVKQKDEVVPNLHLEIAGRAIDVPKVSVFPQFPPGNGRHRDGVLGLDAMASGFVLDFRSMQFHVLP